MNDVRLYKRVQQHQFALAFDLAHTKPAADVDLVLEALTRAYHTSGSKELPPIPKLREIVVKAFAADRTFWSAERSLEAKTQEVERLAPLNAEEKKDFNMGQTYPYVSLLYSLEDYFHKKLCNNASELAHNPKKAQVYLTLARKWEEEAVSPIKGYQEYLEEQPSPVSQELHQELTRLIVRLTLESDEEILEDVAKPFREMIEGRESFAALKRTVDAVLKYQNV